MSDQFCDDRVRVAAPLQKTDSPPQNLDIRQILSAKSSCQKRLAPLSSLAFAEVLAEDSANNGSLHPFAAQFSLDAQRTVAPPCDPGPCPIPGERFIIYVMQRAEFFQCDLDDLRSEAQLAQFSPNFGFATRAIAQPFERAPQRLLSGAGPSGA